MAYTPTTWVTGDIITATKLNNIESGVQSVSSSYTPTTWVTGDIITATKLNNIEQGIANAGGGSSDFSTATLTVTNGTIAARIPFIQTFGDLQFIQGADNMFEIGTYDIVLYKNTAILMTGKTVTGNAELYDEEEGIWLVTGNITITP